VFKLQHLQWLGVLAAAIGCILLGGSAILHNFGDYKVHVDAAYQLERFSIVLDASNAISAERGPANSAMAATDADATERRKILEQSRIATDEAIARMAALFETADPETRTALDLLADRLENGREKVDLAANLPAAEREPRAIERAILSMFSAADSATALRERIGGQMMADLPNLAGEILLANAAASLREQEGRLGSYVVMALVAPADRDRVFLQRVRGTEGVVWSLWNTTVSMADKLLPGIEIAELVQAVRRDYFEGVLVSAIEDADKHTANNSLSPVDFTAKYVPGMRSSELLRSAVVQHGLASLARQAETARREIILSALLVIAIVLVLLIVAVAFRRDLFAPLMRLRDDVLSLARGNHSPPEPRRYAASEVTEIFSGLDVLRQSLAEKQQLEEERGRLNRRLRRLAETDSLTGLLNRRALMNRIDAVFRRADRIGEPLVVALVDIDHFKSVNDTYGHIVGDEVLAGVSRVIKSSLRKGDTLARIGGEEFVIILRRIEIGEVSALLERVRLAVAKTPVGDDISLGVTASFGVAMRPAGSQMEWDEMFSLADHRLYIAKDLGRNRVVMDGFPSGDRQRAGSISL
jgi:diguanylate cyclase (GGDEF)-like protein